jgi:hypothetical protein
MCLASCDTWTPLGLIHPYPTNIASAVQLFHARDARPVQARPLSSSRPPKGRYGRARPPEQGRELASSLPNAEFRLVETGHSPVYEALAAAVRSVLARIR